MKRLCQYVSPGSNLGDCAVAGGGGEREGVRRVQTSPRPCHSFPSAPERKGGGRSFRNKIGSGEQARVSKEAVAASAGVAQI